MDKRGILILKYVINILIFVILFAAMIYAVSKAFKSSDDTEETLTKLTVAFEELEPGNGKLITGLKLDKDTMLIGFNPDSNFSAIFTKEIDMGAITVDEFYITVPKPVGCANDRTCVCMCTEAELDNEFLGVISDFPALLNQVLGSNAAVFKSKLECDILECKNYKDFTFKKENPVKDILTEEQYAFEGYQKDILFQGFVITTTDDMLSYTNIWGGSLDVHVLKNNNNEISICLKSKCT